MKKSGRLFCTGDEKTVKLKKHEPWVTSGGGFERFTHRYYQHNYGVGKAKQGKRAVLENLLSKKYL